MIPKNMNLQYSNYVQIPILNNIWSLGLATQIFSHQYHINIFILQEPTQEIIGT